jgi:nucleobase:cation symporter-1, NCS1 family
MGLTVLQSNYSYYSHKKRAGKIMATDLAQSSNDAFKVEQNGINLISKAERKGNVRELFWVWAGANLISTYIITGFLLTTLNLTFGQMLAVNLLGNLLFAIVGYGGIPGARVGTATLVISRAAFGKSGNIVPSLLSWITVVGWEAVNLVIGAFALYSLCDILGLQLAFAGKLIALLLLAAFTFCVAVLGHATIVLLQKIFTWGLAAVILGLIPQVWSAPALPIPADAPLGATLAQLCIAFTIVAALPISYTNYPADYTRYLPEKTSGRAIVFWTFIGSYLPAVLITCIGFVAARATNLADPVGGFQPMLASWYFNIFVLVVLGGTVTNNFLNTYSSGMSLLAVGLKISRPVAVVFDAILATAAAAYAIFVYDFTTTFIGFLSLMVVWLAPWAGVYTADIWLRKARYEGDDLLSSPATAQSRYAGGFNMPGMVAWVAGIIAAILCTSADMFKSPFAEKFLGGADLSIVVGFIVSAALYILLAKPGINSKAYTGI